MPRNARPPLRIPQRPGGALSDAQKTEISAFVSNALQGQAEELIKTFETAMREFYGHLVAHGCLLQAGVDSIAAAHAARREAEAQEPAEPAATSQPAAIDTPPIDLTSRLIQ